MSNDNSEAQGIRRSNNFIKVEHMWKFVIDVPVTQLDTFEYYIKT